MQRIWLYWWTFGAALIVFGCIGTADVLANPSAQVAASTESAAPTGMIFRLSYPMIYKKLAYIWRLASYVDHTPPFYDGCTNGQVVAFTGQEAADPHQCDGSSIFLHYGIIPGTSKYLPYNGHPGLDIDITTGNGVYAAHAGMIRYVNCGNRHGYGCEIVLQDDGNANYYTRYGHLSSFNGGYVGQHVARGQLIGSSGNTGGGAGPHLHFGVYYSTTSTDDPSDSANSVVDPYYWESQKSNPYLFDQYQWASGYATTAGTNEPGYNWNTDSTVSPEYRHKDRAGRGYTQIGLTGTNDPIDNWWTNSFGSVGAPYDSPTNVGLQTCQNFEGGSYCTSSGYNGFFSDVLLTHWANRYIGWAQREGVISGYSDGTFRPNVTVTRAQIAKILVLGLNVPTYTPASPTFADVLASEWEYVYVESLYHQNVISGYTCGNPEPCPGLYYRPGNNVTRGQLAKMVVLLAQNVKGWMYVTKFCPTPVAGQPQTCYSGQDYYDVPPSNTFFVYVETLYNYNAVTYRQEIDGAGNGGHFYWNWSATRAQAAQFVHDLVYADIPCGDPQGQAC